MFYREQTLIEDEVLKQMSLPKLGAIHLDISQPGDQTSHYRNTGSFDSQYGQPFPD